MTPEQFTLQLRTRVSEQLTEHVSFIRKQNSIPDPSFTPEKINERLKKILANPVEHLTAPGSIPAQEVSRINRQTLAFYNSNKLNAYFKEATKKLSEDKYWVECAQKLLNDTDPLTKKEMDYLLDKLLKDDAFLTVPIRLIFEDADIRSTLQIPRDLTFEKYITDVRQAISNATNIDEITQVARYGPLALTTTAVAAGLVVVWAIAAVVQTVVAAWAYAVEAVVEVATLVHQVNFTVSGANCLENGSYSNEAMEIKSIFANNSDIPIWVVLPQQSTYRRIAIPPGFTTAQYGFVEITAILISGKGNQLTQLTLPAGEIVEEGAYVLFQDKKNPGTVTIQGSNGTLKVLTNESQAKAEIENAAGYCDTRKVGFENVLRENFRMDRIAALCPASFDISSLVNYSIETDYFFQSLKRVQILDHLFKNSL